MITGSRCVIRLGLPGCGKSLDQTETEVLEHLMAGTEVYCCYWINWSGANYHYFPPTRKGWDSIKDKRNCVVVFDELAQIFDPRDWTEEGGEVRRWFQLHRHFHIDIYANTQDVSLVAKSVGIVADEWQYIEKIQIGRLVQWIFRKLFGGEIIAIHKSFLTWQQLKKMAAGWELLTEDSPIQYEWQRINYNSKKIIHSELDEYKQEIIHTYCDICAARQGEQILKEDTTLKAEFRDNEWHLKEVQYCPKHHEQELKVRLSGLYDTDYEPPTEEEEIEFRAFSKQEIWKEYKGLLSPEQNKKKRYLSNRYNSKVVDN